MSIYLNRFICCAIVFCFALFQVVASVGRYCLDEVKYCFTITLPQNDDNLVHFLLEAPSNAGWLGLGIGEDMTGELMIAWVNGDDTITLSQRQGQNGNQPLPTSYQNLNLTSSMIVGNKRTIEFTRPLKVDSIRINTENKQAFAYAYCSTNPGSKDVGANLVAHDYYGSVKLNLLDGSSELSQHNKKLIIAHAVMMFFAWFVAIPGAIFIARFARDLLPMWFKLHIGIQILLSTPVILAGSILSFIAAQGLKFDDPHKIIGFVLFLGFFIQLAIGAIHHHLYDPKRTYIPWWTHLHRWFGRILVVLAALQIHLGLRLYRADRAYFYVYYFYLFILIIAFSFLSFRLWDKRQNGEFIRMKEEEGRVDK